MIAPIYMIVTTQMRSSTEQVLYVVIRVNYLFKVYHKVNKQCEAASPRLFVLLENGRH